MALHSDHVIRGCVGCPYFSRDDGADWCDATDERATEIEHGAKPGAAADFCPLRVRPIRLVLSR